MNVLHASWQTIEDMCDDIHCKMIEDGYKPDCIVGLMRGGIIPARIMADRLEIWMDFYGLTAKYYDGVNQTRDTVQLDHFDHSNVKGKKVLIVDDIWDSGKTMRAVLEHLKGIDIKTATLFYKPDSEGEPDYFASEVIEDDETEWIKFPWENREFEREIRKQGMGSQRPLSVDEKMKKWGGILGYDPLLSQADYEEAGL